ncbi:MAG: Asp-tRNA(Asn)/Glu-tRNA(Gln) amidotransferase subunit GatC [Candidatus Omnitrophota bacterium]|jgi:aspartyl-tRNA(Asn)/glutamyl-tRNA(Gln) amidotransferase subunit C
MAIDKESVKYVAHLARIKLTDKELSLLSRQLEDIVNFIDKLKELDVTKVKPTSHVLPVSNAFRLDKPAKSLNLKDVLDNAPAQKESFFIAPKVIE